MEFSCSIRRSHHLFRSFYCLFIHSVIPSTFCTVTRRPCFRQTNHPHVCMSVCPPMFGENLIANVWKITSEWPFERSLTTLKTCLLLVMHSSVINLSKLAKYGIPNNIGETCDCYKIRGAMAYADHQQKWFYFVPIWNLHLVYCVTAFELAILWYLMEKCWPLYHLWTVSCIQLFLKKREGQYKSLTISKFPPPLPSHLVRCHMLIFSLCLINSFSFNHNNGLPYYVPCCVVSDGKFCMGYCSILAGRETT